MPRLTHARLIEVLHYSPETGVFTWRVSLAGRWSIVPGKRAGCLRSNGYVRIGFKGWAFRAHRLAWFYVYAGWPAQDIDHINGNRSDNRIANLRLASNAENQQNRCHIQSRNTSGFTGVRWHEKTLKWLAEIRTNNKTLYLGLFETLEEAAAARLRAERLYHPFNSRANHANTDNQSIAT